MNQLELKYHAMNLAAEANASWLYEARRIARELGQFKETVSIEDVRARWPYPDVPFGNWAGSIFKSGEWLPAGYVAAEHEGSHGRIVRQWRLKS